MSVIVSFLPNSNTNTNRIRSGNRGGNWDRDTNICNGQYSFLSFVGSPNSHQQSPNSHQTVINPQHQLQLPLYSFTFTKISPSAWGYVLLKTMNKTMMKTNKMTKILENSFIFLTKFIITSQFDQNWTVLAILSIATSYFFQFLFFRKKK